MPPFLCLQTWVHLCQPFGSLTNCLIAIILFFWIGICICMLKIGPMYVLQYLYRDATSISAINLNSTLTVFKWCCLVQLPPSLFCFLCCQFEASYPSNPNNVSSYSSLVGFNQENNSPVKIMQRHDYHFLVVSLKSCPCPPAV